MSRTKKDRTNKSNSGNNIQDRRYGSGSDGRIGSAGFATAIACALQKEFGSRGNAVKTIVRLTSANERAARNWYEGKNGPSGEFLVLLCRHFDHVLETLLILAGRNELLTAKKLVDAKGKLQEILALIDQLE